MCILSIYVLFFRLHTDNLSCASDDIYVNNKQCFFARLGFVQPPSCLKCGYHLSGCGENKKDDDKEDCCELVAWRRDANIPLHPDKLEGNILFLTCNTAKCLVNGDAYPSIRWDSRNKRLLHEI